MAGQDGNAFHKTVCDVKKCELEHDNPHFSSLTFLLVWRNLGMR